MFTEVAIRAPLQAPCQQECITFPHTFLHCDTVLKCAVASDLVAIAAFSVAANESLWQVTGIR
jgi:hypothetical protein